MDLKALVKLAPYLNKRVDDIDFNDFGKIIGVFQKDVPVDQETFDAVRELLKSQNIDKISDMLGSDSVLPKLMTYIKPKEPIENMVTCPHCGSFHLITLE